MNIRIRHFIFLFLSLISCEEVVNPELVSADPVLVVDGIISNFENRNEILLSKTAPFNSPDPNPFVQGAEVKINYQGIETNLSEIENGRFGTDMFQEIAVGEAVELTVIAENRVYEARGEMPEKLILDSVSVIKREEDLSFDDGYYPVAHFTENGNSTNFYMWEIYLNGEFISSEDIILSNDENLNGLQVSFELPYFIALDSANIGDTLTLFNYSLTESAFNYYNGLLSLAASGSPAQAVPDNPITNVRGGALGFFNVCQIDTAKAILK